VEVSRDGDKLLQLFPEKRNYQSGMPMTEAGIDPGLFRDLFVALGEPLGDSGAWSLRIYHKPFVRWIWLGGLFMALGGLLAALDRRYFKMARRARPAVPEKSAVEAT
jgi:cytochrome c-type biogenesis protein CcmF